MIIGEQYKAKIEALYAEMKGDGRTEEYLDQENLGEIKVFINTKPSSALSTFTSGDDTIYVGSNEL